MKTNRRIAAVVVLLINLNFLSCVTRHFPLCQKLSNTVPSKDIKEVSAHMFAACKQHHIQIEVLSANIAVFKGSRHQMKWLQDNYHVLLCDFDQRKTAMGADEYISCLSHAKNWIAIIQQGNYKDLMKPGTLYCDVCVPNQACH